MTDDFEYLGILGIVFAIIIAVCIPAIITIIVGIGFANILGFTGIYWWAFVILFYLAIGAFFNWCLN